MSLLVPAHQGCPGQNPERCKKVVCVFMVENDTVMGNVGMGKTLAILRVW